VLTLSQQQQQYRQSRSVEVGISYTTDVQHQMFTQFAFFINHGQVKFSHQRSQE